MKTSNLSFRHHYTTRRRKCKEFGIVLCEIFIYFWCGWQRMRGVSLGLLPQKWELEPKFAPFATYKRQCSTAQASNGREASRWDYYRRNGNLNPSLRTLRHISGSAAQRKQATDAKRLVAGFKLLTYNENKSTKSLTRCFCFGARNGTWTRTVWTTRPSNVRVCQFRHSRKMFCFFVCSM